MMKTTILAFGIAKEIFNNSSFDMEIEEHCNAGNLKILLEEKYPGLKKLGSYMIAVNNEYAGKETIINLNDEVAVIPPVSGG